MEEGEAAAVVVEPVLGVIPADDVVHGLVFDQLFDQRGGRVPADGAQFQKTDVEPAGEQVFQLGVQRQQGRFRLELLQQFGAQVEQEAHAAGRGAQALQQAGARGMEGLAQLDLGLRLVLGAQGRLVLVLGQLDLLGIGRELLGHQAPGVGTCVMIGGLVPVDERLGAPYAFDFAHLGVDHGLQFGQQLLQAARRERFGFLAQIGIQPCMRVARGDARILLSGLARCVDQTGHADRGQGRRQQAGQLFAEGSPHQGRGLGHGFPHFPDR